MIAPGDALEWVHAPRGGYGYTFRFPARFVAWGPGDSVAVQIVKRDGELIRRTIRDVALFNLAGGRLDVERRINQTA
jgi:hypothetical protein